MFNQLVDLPGTEVVSNDKSLSAACIKNDRTSFTSLLSLLDMFYCVQNISF